MSGKGTVERLVRIEAKPEQIEIDLARTALVVVDMQNVFAGRGEISRLNRRSISGAIRAIGRTRRLADAARAATIPVVYLVMIKDPERKGKSLIKSIQDTKIVDELSPLAGDVVIEKSCYSGFRGTRLDEVLKKDQIVHLIFTGIATNICVESTLRDAYFLDYLPILVSDATSNAGPSLTQQATLWNVEEAFGWVATTEDVLKVLSGE
jgi:ureidoacrylate peracid hydrolase